MKKYDVIVAGYICVDLIPEFKKSKRLTSISELLKPGKLIEVEGISHSLGGLVANTGMALKKFNKKVLLNGLIGDDFMGREALASLKKYNLLEGVQVEKNSGTAFSIVLAPSGIDRIFLESPGCNTIYSIANIDFEAVSQSRLFHFGYPPLLKQFYLNKGEQLVGMFSKIQKMGVVTSLDFSLPDAESESGKINWLEIMKRVLPYTDMFMPSLEEALQIMMPDAYKRIQSNVQDAEIIDQIPDSLIREVGRRILACGTKIVLIKAAHRGAYLLTGDASGLNETRKLQLAEDRWEHREMWCHAFQAEPSKIKSATGAGDTAAAAFISAILDGENPENSLKYAALAGKNNLYCNNIYEELMGWPDMVKEIKYSKNEIVDLNINISNIV